MPVEVSVQQMALTRDVGPGGFMERAQAMLAFVCATILSEPGTTPYHQPRAFYAQKVVSNPQQAATQAGPQVVMGVNVAAATTYDEATKTATYDATVLADFEKLGIAFQEAPKGAGALHPSFGAASLFIDDCPNDFIRCTRLNDLTVPVVFDNQPFCWNYSVCMPCEPGGNVKGDRCQTYQYWNQQCNAKRTCEGDCRSNVTTAGAICDP